MSIFWNVWIIGLTLACIVLVMWVLLANRKVAVSDDEEPENRTTGHVYDGIEEYDNPLPLWWFLLFIGTVIYAGIYLVFYPGLGSFPGVLGWTSKGELAQDQADAREKTSDLYARFMAMPVQELSQDPDALKMGTRLFANNCAVCHGAGGNGYYGFPNLTDNAWIYGGSPEKIKETLLYGRNGNMPAWGEILGLDKSSQVAHYALSLSGLEHDEQDAKLGQPIFNQYCAACHNTNGTGNMAIGAPNLTDDAYLYSPTHEDVLQTVLKGRVNNMPAQGPLLSDEKIHVLTAYVFSLSLDYEDESDSQTEK